MKSGLLLSIFAGAALVLGGCASDGDGGANTAGDQGDQGDSADDGMSSSATATATDTNGMMETGGGETGMADGIGFISDPDGGGATFECDPWLQDCPEGQKCMPWANDGGNAWNATRCTELDPNAVPPGDTCMVEGSGVSGVDNCELGAMCWDVDPETNEGTCTAFCQGSEQNPQCDDPDAACSIANDGVLILCLPECSPIIQDCAEGQACYPINDTFVCAPDASGPDDGVAGDPCEFLNACDPGLICINAASVANCQGAQGCCSPVCDLQNPGMCPGAGEACEPWFDPMMVPPGFEDVGVCALPA